MNHDTTIDIDHHHHRSKDNMNNVEEQQITTNPSEQPQLPATKGESCVSLVYHHLAAMVRFLCRVDDWTFGRGRFRSINVFTMYSSIAKAFD